MVSFCADIDRLFAEIPFLERCKAAKDNGFASVEFTLPGDVGLGQLGDAAAYKGLKVMVITMPADQAALAFEKNQSKSSWPRLTLCWTRRIFWNVRNFYSGKGHCRKRF